MQFKSLALCVASLCYFGTALAATTGTTNTASTTVMSDRHCYKIDDFGLKKNNCSQCNDHFEFHPDGFCNFHRECCKGLCCKHF